MNASKKKKEVEWKWIILYQTFKQILMNLSSLARPEEVFYPYFVLLFITLQALTPLISYLDHNEALKLTLQTHPLTN